MRKGVERRGRPPIAHWILSLIVNRVHTELTKAADERLQAKQLAYEIHKEISPRLKRPPALSTLEKKVSNLLRDLPDKLNPLDEPWTLLSLTKYPIVPEALPAVMRIWAQTIGGEPLTVRGALWIGRLYYIANEDEVQLAYLAETYTKIDMLEEFMADILPPTTSETSARRWAMWLQDCLTYFLTTDDRKPYEMVLERSRKADPEFFSLLDKWEPSNDIEPLHGEDLRARLEDLRRRIERPKKKEPNEKRHRETQNERWDQEAR